MSDGQDYLLMLPLWYAVFLLSTTAHEAGHALAAKLGGDETAYLGGQVTLNPLPHIQREPIGTVLVPLLTFFMAKGQWMMGWASAPYDPRWESRYPGRAALMALAGPAANLALAALAFFVLVVGMSAGWWVVPIEPDGTIRFSFDHLVLPFSDDAGALDGLGRLLSVMLGLNLILLIFNLIPVYPLDGAAVLSGVLEPARRVRDWMRSNALGALAGIVVAWTLIRYLFPPVYYRVLGLLYALGT